jgi:hypothetical protein
MKESERARRGLFLPISIRRKSGANHEEIDERAALCCAKKGVQDQGQARARQVGHSGGARARSRNGRAVCGPAFNDAPSYRAAETPIGREVQREVLTGQAAIHPLLLARQPAEQELTLHRERAIQRARRVRPKRDAELRTGDEKRAAVAGGSKCETGRCQSPGRWFDAPINDRETLTRS